MPLCVRRVPSGQSATPPRAQFQIPESDFQNIPGTDPPILFYDLKVGSCSKLDPLYAGTISLWTLDPESYTLNRRSEILHSYGPDQKNPIT